jgi:YVTN family beta-propeller protein
LRQVFFLPGPDGSRANVADAGSDPVSAIDMATNKPATEAIKVGLLPLAFAITPDGRRVYIVKN